MTIKKFFTSFLAISLISSVSYIEADSSIEEQRILNKLESMSVAELQDRRFNVENQILQLQDVKEATQNPSSIKNISTRIEA